MIVFAYVSTILRHYAKAANSRHILTAIFVIADFVACRIGPGAAGAAPVRLDHPLIVTQLPASDGLARPTAFGRPAMASQPAGAAGVGLSRLIVAEFHPRVLPRAIRKSRSTRRGSSLRAGSGPTTTGTSTRPRSTAEQSARSPRTWEIAEVRATRARFTRSILRRPGTRSRS